MDACVVVVGIVVIAVVTVTVIVVVTVKPEFQAKRVSTSRGSVFCCAVAASYSTRFVGQIAQE